MYTVNTVHQIKKINLLIEDGICFVGVLQSAQYILHQTSKCAMKYYIVHHHCLL